MGCNEYGLQVYSGALLTTYTCIWVATLQGENVKAYTLLTTYTCIWVAT